MWIMEASNARDSNDPARVNERVGRMRSVPCRFEAAMIDLRRLPKCANPLFSLLLNI
jgi:hypothetical protein